MKNIIKKTFIVLTILTLLFSSIYLLSPYFIGGKIVLDLSRQNYKSVDEKVEWNSVKTDLMSQFKIVIQKKIDSTQKGMMQMMSQFLQGLAVKAAQSWLSDLNTIEDFVLLLDGKKIDRKKSKNSFSKNNQSNSNPDRKKVEVEIDSFDQFETQYISLDEFKIKMTIYENFKVEFLMKRNFLNWKIYQIKLPWDVMEESLF